MQIGDLAAQSGVSAKTICYYDSVGLLPPPARADNHYRQYRSTDVERLRLIASARSLGLAISAIAEILATREQGIAPCD
jgi:DNA-binding transcriptional MerR regulator